MNNSRSGADRKQQPICYCELEGQVAPNRIGIRVLMTPETWREIQEMTQRQGWHSLRFLREIFNHNLASSFDRDRAAGGGGRGHQRDSQLMSDWKTHETAERASNDPDF